MEATLARLSADRLADEPPLEWGIFVKMENPGLSTGPRRRRKSETPTDRLADGTFLPAAASQRGGRPGFMSLIEAELSVFAHASKELLKRTQDAEQRLLEGLLREDSEEAAVAYTNIGCMQLRRGGGAGQWERLFVSHQTTLAACICGPACHGHSLPL